MELKEYLKIIKKDRSLFFGLWLAIIFLGIFTLYVQPDIYRSELTVNIVRAPRQEKIQKGKQFQIYFKRDDNKFDNKNTNLENQYDYYYQLESDKSLSAILAKMVKDRALLKDVIFQINPQNKDYTLTAEDDWIISHPKSEVLAPGYIKFVFQSHQKNKLEMINEAWPKILNNKLESIATSNNQSLKIVAGSGVLEKNKKPYFLVLVGVLVGGLLMSWLTVLIKFYFKNE